MPYINYSNATDFVGMLGYLNDITSGLFGAFIVGTILVILFISMKAWRTEVAFFTSSMITAIISVLARGIGLVTWDIMLVFVVIFLVSLFPMIVSRGQD